MKTIEALLVTKGHSFEREPFFKMIDRLKYPSPGIRIHWTHVEHPAAAAVLHPERAAAFDVIVFYDMPGVVFTRDNPPFAHFDPSDQYKADFISLLDSGKGMVFLHHAIADWPTWPEFAELIGGRFHFRPGELGGQSYPGSGYRFDVPQTITVLDTEHPITQGLGETFEIQDEAYMYAVLEDKVTPLLRTDFQQTPDQFRYGGLGFKDHPEGSSLVGWTKQARKSDIAYLQLGHGPDIYEDTKYQNLKANSVAWAASQPSQTR
ncbi:ThuA domain-containing protein [Algisphaera agarilytica]|uniref:ThuA-like domain-containing protein n=1 Tax=Algisphaera agarilytica TaxID=1385975 RepID=A0A7X0LKH4_9BACT|nr:ThuA domain-containing protein [Algisphaera agarilytica]MBB6429917.1 hypothetical protein [Algisphaera agarilytica]